MELETDKNTIHEFRPCRGILYEEKRLLRDSIIYIIHMGKNGKPTRRELKVKNNVSA